MKIEENIRKCNDKFAVRGYSFVKKREKRPNEAGPVHVRYHPTFFISFEPLIDDQLTS